MLRVGPSLHIIAAVLFFLLILGMTWPLALQLNTHITTGQQPSMTVPYLNLWTLAWNHHWLKGKSDSYWDANHFFPHRKTLAYSEPQLGTSLLTFPVIFFGGNTVLAYNLALLIFICGAGMSVYALCWWIFGFVKDIRRADRFAASITSGILYAFSPYMFEEMAVLQLLATPFAPLCLLGLHRFFDQKRWSDGLLSCVGFLGCWYTCAYYGLFLSVFVTCFILFFFHRDLLDKRNLLRGMLIVAVLIGALLPLAYGMYSAKIALSLTHLKEIVKLLSANFLEYFQPPASNLLYGQILGVGIAGNSPFLGGMLLCLASLGIIITILLRYRSKVDTGENGSNLISNSQQGRLSLHRFGVFYSAMAFLGFLLSLGMAFAPIYTEGLGKYEILVWLSPYNLLYKFVPGFSSIRSSYRFCIFVTLFLVMFAGVGMLWLCRRVGPRWRWALMLLLIPVMIFELWPAPMRYVRVPGTIEELPRIYQHVKTLPPDAVLLEFPLPVSVLEEDLEPIALHMYFSTFHWRRLAYGYSGFAPRPFIELLDVLSTLPAKKALLALKASGIQYVVAHWNSMTEEEKTLLQALKSEGNLKSLFSEGNERTLYQIDTSDQVEFRDEIPSIARFTIYETEQHLDFVRLCFHYQMDDNHFLLSTPWKDPIKIEIAWYRDLSESLQEVSKPILVTDMPFRSSRLFHAKSNTMIMDVPSPVPGKYEVVVKHRFGSHFVTKTGVCEIFPHGFVHFHEVQ